MSTTTTTEIPKAGAATSLLDRPAYQYFVLATLVVGYLLNVVDRQVLGILLQSIKVEIQLSDTALGLLGGVAFSVCYSFMGFPIAWLADRWSRVKVLAIAISVWSVATVSCGLARNFASLFASRAMTALGEAGGSPPSHSLISDYFAPSRRATALAVYAMAVPVGTSLGNFVLGRFADWYGWRTTFMLAGIPGLVLGALILLTIKEPPRGYSDGPAARPRAARAPFLDAFKFLLSRNSFMHMSVAAALHSVVWYAGSTFNPAYFQRSHELSTSQATLYIAIFSLIGGIGSFAGGFLSDRLSTKRNDKRWYMWIPGIACVAMVPFQFFAYLSPDMRTVGITFSTMFVLASVFFGPSFAVAQSVATARFRSVSASVLLFIQTIIGLTLGPLLVGKISDLLNPTYGQHSLSYAMAIIGVLNIWAAAHYFLAARRYREDLAQTAALNAAQA